MTWPVDDAISHDEFSLSISVWFDENFPPMSGVAMMLRHSCSAARAVFSRAVARGLREWLDLLVIERERAKER